MAVAALALALAWAPGALAAPPANDTYVNATVVGALPYGDSIDTTDATTESDDYGDCRFAGHTVWYSFTAPSDSRIEVGTSGSSYLACIDVFAGPKGSFVGRAHGDVRARFDATNGTAYYFLVGGPGGSLKFSVHVAPPPPPNDDFDDAAVIGSLPFKANIDTYDATGALDDPSCWGARNVWYSFSALADTRVEIETSATPGDQVPHPCVYTGTRGALSRVTGRNWSETRLRFRAAAGTTYFVLVAGIWPSFAASTLDVTEAPPPPPNDDFDNATVIGSLPYSDSLDTTEATAANDEPGICGHDTSVWYAFTPAHDMRLTANAVGTGSGYTPHISVWTGPRNALNDVLSSGGIGHCSPPLEFDAEQGTTYYFVVGNLYSSLGGLLDFSLEGVLETNIGLSTSQASINYKRSVRVGAHLADFAELTNKTVSIYKTPYHGAKTLVKMAAVDSVGNLSAVVTLTKNTKFTAEWAGEDGWLPAQSLVKTVGVHVLTTTRLFGFFGKSGAYKLYHAGDDLKQTGTVVPNHHGRVLKFIAQIRRGGAWRALATGNFKIRGNGSVTAFLINPRTGSYRVRNLFIGDDDHLGDASAWQYFKVT